MNRKAKTGETRVNAHADLSAKVSVKSENFLMELLKEQENPLLLILDGVQDPHNLGVCLRTADAAGVTAVVAPKDRAVSLTDTVRLKACGAAENIPFVQVTNLRSTLDKLKTMDFWIVGTSDKAKQSLYDVDLKGPLAIVLGSEDKGLRRLTTESCDFLVSLPMLGHVDCLNVAVAAGVCLFEAVRQRSIQT
jgi:23S rRNA (guanosine2251-2'-O)-methyltransferase